MVKWLSTTLHSRLHCPHAASWPGAKTVYHIFWITSANEVMFSSALVCLFVC